MTFEAGNIIMLAVCWGCAALFFGIAVWAYRRKTPMHFWAGTEVPQEEITDVCAYNRAMTWLWAVYGLGFAAAGAAGLYSVGAAGALVGMLSVPGVIVLIIAYTIIHKKYRRVKK